VTGIIEQQTTKQRRRFSSPRHPMRSLLGQFGLHRLKDFALDQRWLGARAYLVLVADLANVKPIAQHVEKWALRECRSAPRFARREVRKNQLAVWLKNLQANEAEADAARPFDRESGPSLLIPWCKPPSKKSREILLPPSVARQDVRPIKVERRAALLRSIARGHAWLEALASGVETVEEIAARHKCSIRHVNMTISMAFIVPGLVKAAIEGRLPRGIGVASLRDAPAEWSL
jgi:hypothetical protein